ncbi:MAG: hypothetical protein IKW37_01575 [Bacteroidaceae bacterium]|nr:hypothetical protein [Bacteroidaceae bacterium]
MTIQVADKPTLDAVLEVVQSMASRSDDSRILAMIADYKAYGSDSYAASEGYMNEILASNYALLDAVFASNAYKYQTKTLGKTALDIMLSFSFYNGMTASEILGDATQRAKMPDALVKSLLTDSSFVTAFVNANTPTTQTVSNASFSLGLCYVKTIKAGTAVREDGIGQNITVYYTPLNGTETSTSGSTTNNINKVCANVRKLSDTYNSHSGGSIVYIPW